MKREDSRNLDRAERMLRGLKAGLGRLEVGMRAVSEASRSVAAIPTEPLINTACCGGVPLTLYMRRSVTVYTLVWTAGKGDYGGAWYWKVGSNEFILQCGPSVPRWELFGTLFSGFWDPGEYTCPAWLQEKPISPGPGTAEVRPVPF